MNKKVESEKPKNSASNIIQTVPIVSTGWEIFRAEIKTACTREEHHDNIRRLVKAYTKRNKITVLFSLYDERCDISEVKRPKYTIESSSQLK